MKKTYKIEEMDYIQIIEELNNAKEAIYHLMDREYEKEGKVTDLSREYALISAKIFRANSLVKEATEVESK